MGVQPHRRSLQSHPPAATARPIWLARAETVLKDPAKSHETAAKALVYDTTAYAIQSVEEFFSGLLEQNPITLVRILPR
jgi:hypothetical protein